MEGNFIVGMFVSVYVQEYMWVCISVYTNIFVVCDSDSTKLYQ